GGGEGDALGVVPGAGRHHPGVAPGGIEAGDAVVGPPDLERARPLEVLGLEEDGPSGEARQVLRTLDRGPPADRFEQTPGRLDVVETDESLRGRGRRRSQGRDPTARIIGPSGPPSLSPAAPDSAWRSSPPSGWPRG